MLSHQSRKNERIDELEKMEMELAREIRQLDQMGYQSREKLKTEPNHQMSYGNQAARKVVKLKPTTGIKKGFKVTEVVVPAVKKPIKHQFSNVLVCNRDNKENRPLNGGNTMGSISGQAKPPVKPKVVEKMIKQPTSRALLQQFEQQKLFEQQQQSARDDLLFDDSFGAMAPGQQDSLEFDLKEMSDEIFNLYCTKQQKIQKKLTRSRSGTTTRPPHQDMQCTFKPAILEKSKKIAQRLEPSFDRLTAREKKTQHEGYRDSSRNIKRYSRQRINTLSRPKTPPVNQHEQPNYPFKPVLTKKSLKQFQNCYLDVVGRNQLWLQQREDKVLKMREEEERQKQLKENQQRSSILTTNTYKSQQSQIELSNFMKQGLVNYFQRLQHASDLKRRTEEAELKYSGKGWSGGVTKAQQFKLSSGSRTKHNNSSAKTTEKEYERAIKELQEKIQKLDI